MYAISYQMQSGETVHRAPSAEAAMEFVDLIAVGGGSVDRIVVTKTGRLLSVVELRQFASDEATSAGMQPPRMARSGGKWQRKLRKGRLAAIVSVLGAKIGLRG